ncbi:transcription termination/antitermination NusG family protein [Parendozoicomonas sp. Alg238-R29]|uniref:transcription termination/antitermination NusG family protein n=1 Tax=Parendozoicomonas sp. Alg238-R29 TaxID=2993446 RepID=UPI00248D4FC3|nr:transcription termination/antitermination NusG family protein [Parendozoicomonas sp. Alg238-R29]
MDEWFVVKTRPRQEERAVENLENQGFAAFCPHMLRKRKQPGRVEACKREPLFPGYIFLLDESRVGGQRWDRVRSTRGVSGFIRFGEMHARVSDEFVEGLRDNEKIGSVDELFKIGQPVIFTEGAYKNIPGVYLARRGDDRCIILINILNSERRVHASLADISA